jgi:DNA-binding CsgD family transcriptional regulator
MPGLVASEIATWQRRYGEARGALRRGLEEADRSGDVFSGIMLSAMRLRVEADTATSARERRDPAEVEASVVAGTEALSRLATASPVTGATDTSRWWAISTTATAEAARLQGHADASAWDVAVDAWQRAGDPYAAAYARWRLVEAFISNHDDLSVVDSVLAEALATTERVRAGPLGRELEEAGRRARLEADASKADVVTSPKGASEARRLGLSGREVEVLALISEGMADRQIAEHLFITVKTAGHHVSHILTKLDVSRRGEAAAIAHRIGLAIEPL